jgi:hypothetical protein
MPRLSKATLTGARRARLRRIHRSDETPCEFEGVVFVAGLGLHSIAILLFIIGRMIR